jgi:crotonobetaine/carnitine-CoA ligase
VGGYDVGAGRTLWDLAEEWAERRGEEDFLVSLLDFDRPDQIGRISWAEFVAETRELRGRLAALGVADGAVVTLALPNSPLTIALWLATIANGAIAQAVDPDAGDFAFERSLAATSPALVIGEAGNAERLRRAVAASVPEARLLVPESFAEIAGFLASAALPEAVPAPTAGAGDVATLLSTSGTSGAPKLVELTHQNIVVSAERLARNSGYTSDDRHYLCSPFFHTNGQMYLVAPAFATGGSVAIVPRFSAGSYFDAARRTGATIASMVAPPLRMALHRALEIGGADPGGLRLIQYGMSLSAADWEAWDRLFPAIEMRQIYGQTESVTGVMGGAPWEADDRETIGRPFLGVEAVRLVGPDGEDVDDGEPGEVWVKGVPGATLMLRYRDAPEATAETLVGGRWLRTGDVMVRRPNGRYEFRGRRSHIIRRGGENLSTYALELDLQRCPLVSDVAVTAAEDATLDAVVVAHLIPRPDYDEDRFLAWCREHLGKRGVPDRIELHDEFPRTGSGRVVAREL